MTWSVGRAEFDNAPTPGLVGNVNSALSQQILDISEAQREPAVEPDSVLDDRRHTGMVFVTDRVHPRGLQTGLTKCKLIFVTMPWAQTNNKMK